MLKVEVFTFNPIQENTYVLYNEHKSCVIVDPGCYFDEEKATLKQYIEDRGLHTKYLLNTHCHLDHVFGNKFVAETWGLKPYIHPMEEKVLQFAPLSGEQWNLRFENYEGELNWLTPGNDIQLDEDRLEILFTPGHSPGSVSFYCRDQGFLIGGDVLFRRSIGRTDLPGGNFDVLINSIKTELFALPDEVIVYPGHGEPTDIGAEKRENPFLT
ncbi:MAG TPA: MBL fold metallo-hydrolase [Parasegetibacter sp.]|jgi:hydroxyacylglutathione hydrolase